MTDELTAEKGTDVNEPLAVVGGLSSSTILSLFLVPVMFMYFAKKTIVSAAEAKAPHAPPAEAHA